MNRKILVVGGNGFVGRAIMHSLAQHGFTPVCGARREPANTKFETRLMDACDSYAVAAASKDIDAIISTVLSNPRSMIRATKNLCKVAQRRGNIPLIHISSMVVYGNQQGLIAEDAPLAQQATGYSAGKIACEHIVKAYRQQGGQVVTMRPGIVYGPGDEQWIGRMGRLLGQFRLGDLGARGDGICNLIYAADVGAACAAALQRPAAMGGEFNLASQNPWRWNDFLIALARLTGATPVQRIADWQIQIEKLAAIPRRAMFVAGRKLRVPTRRLPVAIPPSVFRLMAQQIQLCSQNADNVLGLQRMPEQTGLAESAAWLQKYYARHHD